MKSKLETALKIIIMILLISFASLVGLVQGANLISLSIGNPIPNWALALMIGLYILVILLIIAAVIVWVIWIGKEW